MSDWAKILHAAPHECMQARNTLISTPRGQWTGALSSVFFNTVVQEVGAIVHTTGCIPTLPGRATVVRTIAEKATLKTDEIKERMNNTKALVSISLDGWSDVTRSLGGVIYKSVSPKDFTSHVGLLGVVSMGSTIAYAQKKAILHLIDSYEIQHNRIVSIAVDTCTTSRKHLRIMKSTDEFKGSDLADIGLGQAENDIEPNSDEDSGEDSDEDDEKEESADQCATQLNQKLKEMRDSLVNTYFQNVTSILCVLHLTSLVLQAAFVNKPTMSRLVSTCTDICYFFRKPGIAQRISSFCESSGQGIVNCPTFKKGCETRWGTQLKLVQQVMEKLEDIAAALEQIVNNGIKFGFKSQFRHSQKHGG